MDSILLYISSVVLLSVVLYVGLIIWDRNRIWTLLSNENFGFRSCNRERSPRTVFDGSGDF